MATITRLRITHNDTTATMNGRGLSTETGKARVGIVAWADYLLSVAGGARNAKVEASVGEVSGVAASGTVTISSGSGSITATINGVGIAITWATSDTNSASLLAAAINASANALVANIVTASAASGVCTITAVDKGLTGNCVTLAASGTGATASGARLTGGVNMTYIAWDKT